MMRRNLFHYCLLTPRIYIVFLRGHPIRGESHIQRNATGNVATASFEPLIGFLAYLKPKLWLKKQLLSKNKVTQKVTLAISDPTLASHNSATD